MGMQEDILRISYHATQVVVEELVAQCWHHQRNLQKSRKSGSSSDQQIQNLSFNKLSMIHRHVKFEKHCFMTSMLTYNIQKWKVMISVTYFEMVQQEKIEGRRRGREGQKSEYGKILTVVKSKQWYVVYSLYYYFTISVRKVA